jgi:hypothetical protein
LTSQFFDGLFEVGIVSRESQRRAILHERVLELALAAQRVGKAADRGQVFRRRPQHLLEFVLRFFVLPKFDERATEGDTRRQIRRMDEEAGAAHVDRFLQHARPPVLFRQLGKSNRRRVLLDPSSEIFKTRRFGHCRDYWTTTCFAGEVFVRPVASMTVSVIDQVPATVAVNELVGLEPPTCVTTAPGLVIV